MSNDSTFIVLLIGIFGGIAAFAFSHALSAWRHRHRGVAADGSAQSSLPILLRILAGATVMFVLIRALYALVPHTVAEHDALLVGRDLFSVRTLPGFIAEFPDDRWSVEEGEDLVRFFRNPDPKQAADAELERRILTEKLTAKLLSAPEVDSFIRSQYDALNRRLDLAGERERQLVRQKSLALLAEREKEATLESDYQRVKQELTASRFNLEQREAELKLAEQELESTAAVTAKGVVSKLDHERFREKYERALSRLNQEVERERLLQVEHDNLIRQRAASSEASKGIAGKLDEWLEEVSAEKSSLLARYASLQSKLEEEESRAEERHQAEIAQLNAQLERANEILSAFQRGYRAVQPVVSKAPWGGVVGFRNPSPSNPAADSQPILTLYKPGHVWARVRIPKREATRLRGALDIMIEDTSLPAHSVEFKGRITERVPLNDDKVELRVACDPPPRLMRRLADDEPVELSVAFRTEPISLARLESEASGWLRRARSAALSAWSRLRESPPSVATASSLAAGGAIIALVGALMVRRRTTPTGNASARSDGGVETGAVAPVRLATTNAAMAGTCKPASTYVIDLTNTELSPGTQAPIAGPSDPLEPPDSLGGVRARQR